MCLLLITTVTTTYVVAMRYQTTQYCPTALSIMIIGTNQFTVL